jgi:glyoxylase-like metal-dependent hydrolase (beta-lactamase superfamily II)
VRAVGLHADVVVAVSRAYRTTCTLVRSGAEAFCIDSPVFPDELEILPAIAEQSGFGVVGLLATHGDWDHLLGQYAFPEAPLGCAETTAAVLVGQPGRAQRELRDFDEELYVERPRPLRLGSHPPAQSLPVPGHCGIGELELELHPADGHTEDGMAIWVPWARVLVCGDYLSPVEIPMISPGGSASAYLATLARLEPLVEQAEYVVPGHGEPLESTRAAAILREDRAYLQALLETGAEAKLPLARRSGEQRRIHAENAARVDPAAA